MKNANVGKFDQDTYRPEDEAKWREHALKTDGIWGENLDDRQKKEVTFARLYAREFAHGTAGHNHLMLIAKLADMLDVYEDALHYKIDYINHMETRQEGGLK